MRTNIVLNDDLLTEASRYTSVGTKRGIIEEALQTFVRVKSDEARRASYAERVRKIQAEMAHLKFSESAVDLIRRDRESH